MVHQHSRRRPRRRSVAVLLAAVLGSGFLAGVALAWLRVAPAGLPVSYPLLGGLLLVQLGRAARMDDWLRRGAALATVPAVLVVVLGLQPAGFCLTPSAPGCGPGLRVQPLLLLTGLFATGTTAGLDVLRD